VVAAIAKPDPAHIEGMNAAVSTLLAKPEVSDDDNEPDGMPQILRAVESPIVIEALVREYRDEEGL
jgi:hypothetical protein